MIPADEYLTITLMDLADQYSPDVVLAEARSLFGLPIPSSPSRVSDPDTAQDAGNRVRTDDVRRFSIKTRQAKLLAAFDQDAMTAQEAARAVLGYTTTMSAFDGCRRRVSDLLAAGFIIDSGERRTNEGSLDPSIVWKISPAGIGALHRLRSSGWSVTKATRDRSAA